MHYARDCLPLLLVLSLGQCVKAQSLYSPTAQKITLRDAHIPAQVRDEICAVAMKAFDYPDVGVVRKIVLDSSVSYLKLARDGSSAILVEADGPDALGANREWPYLDIQTGGKSRDPASGWFPFDVCGKSRISSWDAGLSDVHEGGWQQRIQ